MENLADRARRKLFELASARLGLTHSRLLLGVGHPRTGTGYAASVLQHLGLDVGHEIVGKHGVVCWHAGYDKAPPACRPIPWSIYDFQHVFHVVRRSRPAVLSIAFTEMTTEHFRLSRLGVKPTEGRIHDAITSYRRWSRKLVDEYDIACRFRIEDNHDEFRAFVEQASGRVLPRHVPKGKVNTRPAAVDGAEATRLLAPFSDELDEIDAMHGYDS